MTIASAVIGAGSTMLGAVAQSNQMKAQASSAQQQADIEGKWNERQAQEQVAASQREAMGRKREASLLQSKLTATAGDGASDKTVMDLWGGIEKEGGYNAANALAAGQQSATGLRYQANLGKWSADANARIAKQGAKATLLGGALSSASQIAGGFGQSRMAARYGQPQGNSYRYG